MKLIIVPSDHSPERILKLVSNGRWAWVYLGGDIREVKRWEAVLGDGCPREAIGDLFQKTADALEPDFLKWIDRLGTACRGTLGWWLGQIAEKNTNISTLFLQMCLLKSALHLLEQTPGDLVVVSPWKALRDALRAAALSRGWKIRSLSVSPPEKALQGILLFTGMARVRLALLYKWCLWRAAMKRLRIADDAVCDVLLHTWLRPDCVAPDGTFIDRYFGELPDKLAESDRRCLYCVLPGSFAAPVRSWVPLLDALNRTWGVFPAHRYARWRDIVAAMFYVPILCNIPRGKQIFSGMDVTPLMQAERSLQRWSGRPASAYLYYKTMRRISDTGNAPGYVIYTYENHSWEKALCLGTHEGRSKTRTIGYQHSYVPWGFLSYMAETGERRSACMPDRIVANGPFWGEWFRSRGYEDVSVAGALRTAPRVAMSERIPAGTRPMLFVCPTVCLQPTLELILQVHRAFADDNGVEVWIKPHPIGKLTEDMCRDLLDGDWPAHFHYTEEPAARLLQRTSVLIYTSTSVVYEALTLGIPVVAWRTEFEIDRDPLRWQPEIRCCAATPAELRQLVAAALDMLPDAKALWKRTAQDVARKCQAPIGANVVEAFLSDKMSVGQWNAQ